MSDPLVGQDALRKAAEAALEHVLELENAWERGAVASCDGDNGRRSNRNTDVRCQLTKELDESHV